jgi:hypothetical protein
MIQQRKDRRGPSRGTLLSISRALGWFSLGLGAYELAAPGKIARALGVRGAKPVVQFYGAREVASGLGVLGSADPTPFLWSRVAGDAMDIATLATAGSLRADNPKRTNAMLALGAVVAVTALDVYCASKLSQRDAARKTRRAAEPDLVDDRSRRASSKSATSARALQSAAGSRGARRVKETAGADDLMDHDTPSLQAAQDDI